MQAHQIYTKVADKLDQATSLPSEAYLEGAVFTEECDKVIRPGWVAVAHVSEIPNPGDYRSTDLFGEALVIIRDKDDNLNVLSRICRHRAMPLVEGTGNKKALVCPYHLWRYGADGSFKSAPGMDKTNAPDPKSCSLPRIRHEVWGGWVFVNLSGEAEPLTPQLTSLTERLESWNLDEMIDVGYLEFDSPWNWKVMIENFMESYHHIGTHVNTLQMSNPGLGTYSSDMEGPFAALENPAKSESDAPFTAINIFPATMAFFLDGPLKSAGWYEMCNVKKDHFTLRIHLLMPAALAADEALVSFGKESLRTIHLEDIPFCEGVQRGLSSASYKSGPLSPLEACNWKFHRYLKEKLVS